MSEFHPVCHALSLYRTLELFYNIALYLKKKYTDHDLSCHIFIQVHIILDN